MVCCALLAALLGLILRPFVHLGPDPLAWRPGTTGNTHSRAVSRWASFGHALAGIVNTARHETNMRIHLAISAVVVLAGAWLRIDPKDWRWLILAIVLVLVAELLNTAVERTCDAITLERHPAIKAAKDAAAGAVLIAAVAAAVIGASVFMPALMRHPMPTMPLCQGNL